MPKFLNVVLRDFDFHFQGQTVSCYAFRVKKIAHAADGPGRFASTRTATAVKFLPLFIDIDIAKMRRMASQTYAQNINMFIYSHSKHDYSCVCI